MSKGIKLFRTDEFEIVVGTHWILYLRDCIRGYGYVWQGAAIPKKHIIIIGSTKKLVELMRDFGSNKYTI